MSGLAAGTAGALLLVEDEAHTRSSLSHLLAVHGFAVTSAGSSAAARTAATAASFAYAVIGMRFGDNSLQLIERLREHHARLRIVVVTDVDSFATTVLALRAGADDYLPKPVNEAELVDALLDRRPVLPPVPGTPLGAERRCWEHIVRIFEQCGRNLSETARRLGMHRRTLQRIFKKRAPYRDRLLGQ